MPHGNDVVSCYGFAGQESWHHQVENRGLVIHDTTGETYHRNILNIGQHEHGTRQDRGTIGNDFSTGSTVAL